MDWLGNKLRILFKKLGLFYKVGYIFFNIRV